jgi:hypothetical protein
MSAPEHPAELRARARSLRTLATDLERSPVMSLDRDAGPDTWCVPRGAACLAALRTHQGHVHQAADDLRWLAHRLDLRADELDAARARSASQWPVG